MLTKAVRLEDVEVFDCVDVLVHQLGEPAHDTGAASFEEESWAIFLWCLSNGAVYYAAQADEANLDAARALAVSKGCTKVVVECLSAETA